ncbi:MAG: FAD-binding domain-containing protein [Planctomycetaceae bacterium]
MSAVAIWWVKRDARLADNACLTEAERLGLDVLPFFAFEPSLLAADDTSEMHIQTQWQAVSGLRTSLRTHKADIIIAHGEVVEKLAKLHAIVPFTHVLAHEEIGNDLTFRRDKAVADWCRRNGVMYREFPQSSVRRSGINRDRLHELWQARIVKTSPLPIPTIQQADPLRKLAASTTFPQLTAFAENHQWQAVSEADARITLTNFLDHRGRWYRGGISSPNTAFTSGSRLSAHLAWGTLTARQVWHAVQERLAALDPDDPKSARWKLSLQSFLSRLHWRDHFTQRLESEPVLEFQSLHPSYRDLPYENDERLHAGWREGNTGFPMIDAVMRCLAATGFVNFRMRAMVVSFACHVLHLDWRLIHPHLARVFRDYDPGIHLNQLQMQAGVVGLNTIRVYNPTKQLTDWDADCRFVKQWIPELENVPAEQILNRDALPGYPSPIVDFAKRSKHMTSLLYGIRKSAAAREATPAVLFKHGSRKKSTRKQPASTRRKRVSPRKQPPGLFDDLPSE